jgi:hypothetical protein
VASQWRARRIINLHLVRKVLLFAVYAAHAMQVSDSDINDAVMMRRARH